ncbi:hypothetical protein [uncultured Kordia sp.]|uniref:hypothetical protein n=1 Tax=uncultured Kordia sp. TaxID=507699 RepID=UPI00262F936A|nr:hypothetical protein [uncultured Kordia sp.]
MIKSILCAFVLLISFQTKAQNNYKLEATYMNCMCSLFDDNGVEFKSLIKKAEQKLISAELLQNTSGESYITLYKNIRMAIDGRISNFGISDYVIKRLLDPKNTKKYSKCMDGILKSPDFKDSKLSKFITMSSSGNNPKITDLTSKMLEIFEAKDFNHEFYKYLTFSLIDKYHVSNKK